MALPGGRPSSVPGPAQAALQLAAHSAVVPSTEEQPMKRVLVLVFAGTAAFAVWRRWTDRRNEAELWAEATDPV